VVPLGVDAAHFSPGPRAEVGAAGELRLLFAGRLRYYKGLDTLLHALATLPPHIGLDVVGTGPMESAWRKLADSLDLRGRVRFRGELDDTGLVEAYRHADLFVLPCNCRAEAFGTVLLEAMACGVPCVTCEVGSGTSWVVEEGRTGRIVPPSDATALAQAIAGLDADRAALRAFGAAARRCVEERFTESAMVAAVQRVYLAICGCTIRLHC
jgi:rhamnosyl/mannosyltransferase